MYVLHFGDYVVMLHSQRLIIKVAQPTIAMEIKRLTWDPGIILIVGLHSHFWYHNMAGHDFRVTSMSHNDVSRWIWTPILAYGLMLA